MRLLGLKRLIQRPEAVGVEVVHHQHDLLCAGVVQAQQVLDLMCPVDPGALRPGLDTAPSPQWPGPAEDRAGAVTDVLAVLPVVTPGPGRDRLTGVAEQLVRL